MEFLMILESLSNIISLDDVIRIFVFGLLYILILVISKYIKELFVSCKISQELSDNDNTEIALSMSGYHLAITFVFASTLLGSSKGLLNDVIGVLIYSSLGIVLLNISRYLNNRFLFRKQKISEENIESQNTSMGIVQFGIYVAVGLIASSAIVGENGDIITTLVFFTLGQLSLFTLNHVYELLIPYDIQDEVLNDNKAAAIAFSGTVIALGLIVSNSIFGDLTSWVVDITYFLFANIICFALLPIIRFLVNKLILVKSDLNTEIARDKNIGAGILEAITAISLAIILIIMI